MSITSRPIKAGPCTLALCLAAGVAVAGCGSTSQQAQAQGRGGRGGRGSQAAVTVRAVRPQRISIQRRVDLSGTLLSPDEAKVSSEVAGIVRQVPVELGTEVRPGDVLVRIEPRELELAQERAESALRQVEAQLGLEPGSRKEPPPDEQIASVRQAAANRDDARAAYARADALVQRGLLSQVDHDTAQTRLKVGEANYQAALDNAHALKASLQDRRAALDLADKKLNDAAIRAPVGGSISERLVQPGEYIREDTQVVTIVQMQPLKLRTAVQEKFAGLIKPGQAVEFRVQAFPDRTFTGQVAFVSPAVDQTTRTFAVEVLVENKDRVLKPGFFATGTVATRLDTNVLAVAEDAVSTLAGVSSAYVIQDDGTIRQQGVTLGAHVKDLWEILDGLKGDERLAASNLGQLATGTHVSLDDGAGDGEGGEGDSGGGTARRGGRRGGA
jgi:RND family efflux transporter MFP subunit